MSPGSGTYWGRSRASVSPVVDQGSQIIFRDCDQKRSFCHKVEGVVGEILPLDPVTGRGISLTTSTLCMRPTAMLTTCQAPIMLILNQQLRGFAEAIIWHSVFGRCSGTPGCTT